ncbi:hypothetical protein HPB47_027935 [Ixodes persulcatus]|uniref:Uncharacterized protein n=1 Tax=Ixodes persulcatus TaxID=34615 RepID=A0AC60PWA8_IXOPE|nr:hypothetical protein HPB47_027935 [Ixodes persulcatus]
MEGSREITTTVPASSRSRPRAVKPGGRESVTCGETQKEMHDHAEGENGVTGAVSPLAPPPRLGATLILPRFRLYAPHTTPHTDERGACRRPQPKGGSDNGELQ